MSAVVSRRTADEIDVCSKFVVAITVVARIAGINAIAKCLVLKDPEPQIFSG
jgi:hypothetical protein